MRRHYRTLILAAVQPLSPRFNAAEQQHRDGRRGRALLPLPTTYGCNDRTSSRTSRRSWGWDRWALDFSAEFCWVRYAQTHYYCNSQDLWQKRLHFIPYLSNIRHILPAAFSSTDVFCASNQSLFLRYDERRRKDCITAWIDASYANPSTVSIHSCRYGSMLATAPNQLVFVNVPRTRCHLYLCRWMIKSSSMLKNRARQQRTLWFFYCTG